MPWKDRQELIDQKIRGSYDVGILNLRTIVKQTDLKKYQKEKFKKIRLKMK